MIPVLASVLSIGAFFMGTNTCKNAGIESDTDAGVYQDTTMAAANNCINPLFCWLIE